MLTVATSHSFRVEVKPFFLPAHSNIEKRRFLWAYTIRITNEGEAPATLVSRYWHITDGLGEVHEVRGPGVVGQQPSIVPGETFEYTSTCPLSTQCGEMRGHYNMRATDGTAFQIEIPPFTLYVPALAN